MLLHLVGDDTYGFFFPDAAQFERHWESALSNPEEDYQIQSSLQSVFDWIEVAPGFGEPRRNKIWDLIQEADVDSKALTAAGAVAEWNEKNDREAFNEARAAISLLDIGFENATARDWNSVATFCLQKIVELENQIGSAGQTELKRVVELMGSVTNTKDVHLGNLADLIRLLLDNAPAVKDSQNIGKKAFVICIQEANKLQNQQQFFQERDLLSDIIELAEILDIRKEGIKNRYVDTYRTGAKIQSQRGRSLEASELINGLNDGIVLATLSDDEKEEWKSRLRSAVKSAARELKKEGTTLDSPHQRFLHQSHVENIVKKFEHIELVYDTHAALFWLLSNNELVPGYQDDHEPDGISEIISRAVYSHQGHLINFDPTESDLPSNYPIRTRITISVTVSVFASLIKNNSLQEIDIYTYLNRFEDADQNQIWYLSRFVENIFEDRDAEAIHLGAPRIESLLYDSLMREGEDVDALMDEGTGTRTLGSLIPNLSGHLSQDFQKYLDYMYNKPIGQMFGGNIRNRVAHGLLLPPENNRFYSLLILADILRILTRLNKTKLQSNYGIPTSILFAPDSNTVFPIVVKSYHESSFPTEQDLVRYLEESERTVEEIGDYFDVPFELAVSCVKLYEKVGKVSLDPENETVELV